MNVNAEIKNLKLAIQSIEEDLFQYSGIRKNLCRMFENSSPDESAVLALYGDCDVQKTSVKYLLKMGLATRGDKSPTTIDSYQ